MKKYYSGTELKFALTITSEGFDMDANPWKAIVKCGNRTVVCTPDSGANVDDNGQWYIMFDSKLLGTGLYYIIVEIDVPDLDFDDGYRHEVLKQEAPLCNVLKV